ncbi:MAG: TRAP transporter substrate-binding protein [Gemmatimonadetes bacterium]|nr:TRAP transporter substrate-binding protein [Gemmatimonadota bacterium]
MVGWRSHVERLGRRPVGCLALSLAVALVGCGPSDPDGPIELTFGHVGAPGSLFARSAEEFAARANARLGERARVLVYGSSQLGSDDVLLQKLKLGTVDLALPSTIMSSQIDAFGLFEMPYLVQDREHMRRIEGEIVWPTLAPLAEEAGYRILGVWENGFRHVTNNVRPIQTPEDLAGIKLRTPRGIWRVKLFQRFGANPTPMPLSEVFIALQTGVMDGQENPLAQIYSSRLHEVQAYLSLTSHVYTPAYVTVSVTHFARLPEDVQRILSEEARAVQAFVHEAGEEMDRDLLAQMEEAGMQVNRADRASFLEDSQAIYDEFSATVQNGKSLIDRALPLAYP